MGSGQQAVRRLYEQVIAEKKDTLLNINSPQSSELKQLWEWCGDANAVVAGAACDALVTMTQNGHADFYYVMNSLLNLVPSAKSIVGICNGMTNLLVMQLATASIQDDTEYKSPYGIRTRPHPFVTILTNRPESWPVLVVQVKRVLGWQDEKVMENGVMMLTPFLTFALLEPPQSAQFASLRLILPRALLDGPTNQVVREKVLWFLKGIVPCLQVRNAGHLGEVTSFLEQLVAAVVASIRRGSGGQAKTLSRLIDHCLVLCPEAERLAQDVGGLLHLVETTVTKYPAICRSERLWLLVCRQLTVTPVHLANHLLSTAVRLLAKDCPFPRHLVAMMTIPALSVLTAPPSVGAENHPAQALAAHFLQAILQNNEKQRDTYISQDEEKSFGSVTEDGGLQVYARLSKEFDSSSDSVFEWLLSIHATLQTPCHVPSHVTYLVASIAVLASDKKILQMALDILSNVAKVDSTQVPNMLPLLMFCVGCHGAPENRLLFFNTMPKVATTKVAIAPTLKTLQQLGSSDALRPLALRLVTSLWTQQERCFPYLQKMLLASDGGSVSIDTQVNELLVAKAACIKDICEVRPHQHGADMLAPLSAILDQCTLTEDEVPASLALEGLALLCDAEVVDIRTAWAVLAPKLRADKRPRVVRGVCQLFSLVPRLAVNTPVYEEFTTEVVSMLWAYSQHEHPVIASAAFTALAAFAGQGFQLDLLPKSVTDDFRQAAVAKAEADGELEPEMPETPGVCYVRLLPQTPDAVIPALRTFITSLVREEVTTMPRGIYHASYCRQTSSNQNKAISSIPEFLQSRYDKNKQPGLRSSLAAGLLFSYDPPLEGAHEGKVRRMSHVSHGRNYHRMFYTLLHEVSMQPSDWHRCLATPQAWVGFMERCYHAYIESRKAELSLALDQGQVNDPEEHQLHTHTAWLWCRDKLVDLIKSASRGGPSIQANCVTALAGLTIAATKYASDLEEDAAAAATEATEYLSHRHWLSIVTNTIMSILDPKFEPTGRVFSMCQQRPGQPLSSASVLARGGACLALPLLVPVLVTINTDIIYQMIDSVMAQLPGQPRCDEESPALQFFHGLGLGMLLARLFDEHFVDVAGIQGEIAVWKGVHGLEVSSFGTGENRLGCLLGLAVCAGSMCGDGRLDTRAHVYSLHEQLAIALETMDHHEMAYQGICICIASTMVAAYAGGMVAVDVVNQFVARVYEAHVADTRDSGVAAALGGMCSGLQRAGHSSVSELGQKLATTWMEGLSREDVQTLERLANLEGIMSLAGADNTLFKVPGSSGEQQPVVKPSSVVKAVQELLTDGQELGLLMPCAWRLGQLYLSGSGRNISQSSVPSTFGYLPETSLLKPISTALLEAGKTGTMTVDQLSLLLSTLADGSAKPLPPINWAGLLAPIMRLSLGAQIQSLCLQVVLHQGASSPSASLFLTSWLLPPLWDSLKDETRQLTLDNLPVIIKAVPAPKLRDFLGKGFVTIFEGDNCELQTHALQGLAAALKVPDPPQSVTLVLYQTVEKCYSVLPQKNALYPPMCECLQEAPDLVVDSVTKDDFSDGRTFGKAVYVRCYLVSHGNQPMAWLNAAVEAAMWETDDLLLYVSKPTDVVLGHLIHCFHGCHSNTSGKTGPNKLNQWLLELMGHIKNVATGVRPPPDGVKVTPKTIEFAFCVFAAAVVIWSNTGESVLLGRRPMTGHVITTNQSEHLADFLLSFLPSSLVALLAVEPWKQLTSKVLDWLIRLHGGEHVTELPHIQAVIRGCIYGLRHTVDFRKMATWSEAYSLV